MRCSLHLFWLGIKGRRYRLMLWLFPRLRDHEKLRNTIDQINATNSRYLAEISILKSQMAEAAASAQTNALTVRQALDRATQLTHTNEQLQEQLSATVREMADRLERAYGAVTNHLMLGGIGARRPMYPWIPFADAPPMIERNTKGPIGKTNLRGQANVQTKDFLDRLHVVDPKMQEAAMEAFQARLEKQAGQMAMNANGDLMPAEEPQPVA